MECCARCRATWNAKHDKAYHHIYQAVRTCTPKRLKHLYMKYPNFDPRQSYTYCSYFKNSAQWYSNLFSRIRSVRSDADTFIGDFIQLFPSKKKLTSRTIAVIV